MLYLAISDHQGTELCTEKKFVHMVINFFLHNNLRKDGTSIVYLRISSEGKKIRYPLNLYVDRKLWNSETQRLVGKSDDALRNNLILDNIKARLTDIQTDYHLKRIPLTGDKLLQEFKYNIPKVDFLSFFEREMEEQKTILEQSTIKRHKKVLGKLRNFKSDILFSQVNEKFILDFETWCKIKGNKQTTISGDLAVIKKYIRIAIKKGIHTAIQSDEIKVKRVNGMRESLSLKEVRILTDFYEKEPMTKIQRHALGLFLFSCWTGLRISDLKKLTSYETSKDVLLIEMHKGKKPVRIPLNNTAQNLAKEIDWNLKYSEQKLRDELHITQRLCKIKKNVTFHIGRHTFATNYYRATKDLLQLQLLLGHTNVRETMIYTHIVDTEDDAGVHMMDLNF